MAINIRDLAMLDICNEQKFMNLELVAVMFFPGNRKALNWPMKCVRKLVNEGLMAAEKPSFCSRTLYRVTRKGVALLRKHGLGQGLGAIEKIDTRTWEHDLWVTEVRIIFHRVLGLKHWRPERKLKQEHEGGKVPDGIVFYEGTDLIIEVERWRKKKEYYRNTFLNACIRQYANGEIVLYITANEADKKWLMKEAGGWSKIYFATITELREMKDSVTFVNGQGQKFILHRKEDYSRDRSNNSAEGGGI